MDALLSKINIGPVEFARRLNTTYQNVWYYQTSGQLPRDLETYREASGLSKDEFLGVLVPYLKY